MFLARYSTDGDRDWAKSLGDTAGDRGTAVCVGPSGNLYMAGVFGGTVDFGGGGLTSSSGADLVVASFDSGGGYVWAKPFSGNAYTAGVAADASGISTSPASSARP